MKKFTDVDEITEVHQNLYQNFMFALRTKADDVRIALFYFGATTALLGGLFTACAKLYRIYDFVIHHWHIG